MAKLYNTGAQELKSLFEFGFVIPERYFCVRGFRIARDFIEKLPIHGQQIKPFLALRGGFKSACHDNRLMLKLA
jgi:hypothetical protein